MTANDDIRSVLDELLEGAPPDTRPFIIRTAERISDRIEEGDDPWTGARAVIEIASTMIAFGLRAGVDDEATLRTVGLVLMIADLIGPSPSIADTNGMN